MQPGLLIFLFTLSAAYSLLFTASLMRLKGFEPLAHCLEGSCSIQLSYRRKKTSKKLRVKSKRNEKKLQKLFPGFVLSLLTFNFLFFYRGERIRTSDPLLPRQVR